MMVDTIINKEQAMFELWILYNVNSKTAKQILIKVSSNNTTSRRVSRTSHQRQWIIPGLFHHKLWNDSLDNFWYMKINFDILVLYAYTFPPPPPKTLGSFYDHVGILMYMLMSACVPVVWSIVSPLRLLVQGSGSISQRTSCWYLSWLGLAHNHWGTSGLV